MTTGVELQGKKVLVVGLARTGTAVARFCDVRGAHVTVSELRPEADVAADAAELRAAGNRLELGGHCQETFLEPDLIVLSPGVPFDLPELEAARQKGIAVWSEIELASRFLRGRLVAVTGSNGKTTTTTLLGHILETAGVPARVSGNIGTPLVGMVDGSTDETVHVVEISSFQLEAIWRFRPHIAVLLNLTPDHLDRHGTFNAYVAAKARVFSNQGSDDFAVLNADDAAVEPFGRTLSGPRSDGGPRIFAFSRQKALARGCYLLENEIIFRDDEAVELVLEREDIPLRGEHNVENVLAAVATARLLGVRGQSIREAVRSFRAVEHRLEFVAEVGGVAFYNDSKATNVDAALKAIAAFDGRLLLILGGKDKGSDYAPLREPVRERVMQVFLIGAAADKIARALEGAATLSPAGTLARAVRLAFERARAGDTVLLAPACASFDQFENFEHRGRVFKQEVRKLEQEIALHTS